jgi:hypothetical protein
MRVIRKYGCDDNSCPAVMVTDDPDTILVQGSLLADGEALADIGTIPRHERVVALPRALLEEWFRDGSS